MGMVLGLAPLSDETIERLLADPPLVWAVIVPDDPEFLQNARLKAAARKRPGFFARLFGASPRAEDAQPTPAPEPLVLREGEGKNSDLDKAWHGIHFLLTGSGDGGNPPLDFLVAGGREVGDEDVGYGTARVFSAAQTRIINGALSAISDDQLRARFDGQAMTKKGIYPDIWDRDPADDDTLGYAMEYVTTLRETLAEAVTNGYGIMVTLS